MHGEIVHYYTCNLYQVCFTNPDRMTSFGVINATKSSIMPDNLFAFAQVLCVNKYLSIPGFGRLGLS